MFTQLIRNVLGKMPMPEPEVPKTHKVVLPANDFEPEKPQKDLIDALSMAMFIKYEDAEGEISQRRISVKRVSKTAAGHLVLSAYCYERKAPRAFRVDRIWETVDLETGEVLDTKEKILENFNMIEESMAPDLKASTNKALRKRRHGLNVLVYMARCDGHFHYEEENIIIHYLMDQCFDTEFDDEYLMKRLRKIYPDTDAFFDSLDYLDEKNPEALQKLAGYAAQLVQSDGELVKEELNFISEIQAYAS